MHKQAINHKQAIIGGGYLFTENACLSVSGQEINLGPGVITVIGSLCPIRVDPCLSM